MYHIHNLFPNNFYSQSLKQNYPTHFDSHNCFIYHTLYKKYYIYARYNSQRRCRNCQLFIYDDINFTKIKPRKIAFGSNIDNIYCSNIMQLPNSPYFISSAMIQKDKVYSTQRSLLSISRDGINWKLLSSNWLKFNYQYTVIPNIIEFEDNLYIYVNNTLKNRIELWKTKKHRLSYIEANDDKEKILITKKLKLLTSGVNINYKTYKNGYIIMEYLDIEKKTLVKSKKMIGNNICDKFKPNIDLKKIFYIKLILNNCCLYSMNFNIEELI